MARFFMNPANHYTEPATSRLSWLWVLLFGWIYFLAQGVWLHAAVLFLVQSFFTAAAASVAKDSATLALVLYSLPSIPWACAVYAIMATAYRRRGWIETSLPHHQQTFGARTEPELSASPAVWSTDRRRV